jgi:hypothetical protein
MNTRCSLVSYSDVGNVETCSEPGGPTLPGLTDGKPGDAVFKALSIVPMTGMQPGIVREGHPFDMEELIRLIQKESQA